MLYRIWYADCHWGEWRTWRATLDLISNGRHWRRRGGPPIMIPVRVEGKHFASKHSAIMDAMTYSPYVCEWCEEWGAGCYSGQCVGQGKRSPVELLHIRKEALGWSLMKCLLHAHVVREPRDNGEALAAAFVGDEATLRDTMDRLGYSQHQIDARIAAMRQNSSKT